MAQGKTNPYGTTDSLEARCDAVLLGRLGDELAQVYRDSLQAPLPPTLQALIDRLDQALRARSNGGVSRTGGR